MELSSLKLKQLLIFQEGAFKSQTFWGGFFFFFFFLMLVLKVARVVAYYTTFHKEKYLKFDKIAGSAFAL